MPLLVSQFLNSGEGKALFATGESLLASLTGCKIKPKGTPYDVVAQTLPKFFHTYGSGRLGSNSWRASQKSGGAVFDSLSGIWIKNIDSAFPLEQRKRIEATARKPCESVTGDASLFFTPKPETSDRGIIMLADGQLYDAAIYNMDGGTLSNPVKVGIKPRGSEYSETSGQIKHEYSGTAQAGFGSAALGILALGYLAFKGK